MDEPDVVVDLAPRPIAEVNVRAVVRALESVGSASSITDLIRMTTLSRPTVSAAIAALRDKGAVAIDESTTSTPRGGRPSRRYRLATDTRFVLSAVINPHHLYAQLADLDGRVIADHRVQIESLALDREALLDQITDLLHSVHQNLDADTGELTCVSISTLGIVRESRTIVLSHTFPMLHGDALHDRLAAQFGVPVVVENDANCGALAEACERPKVSTMIGLLVGEILGCGVVLDGRLHRGAHGAAGELTSTEWNALLEFLQSPGDVSAILRLFTRAASGEPDAVAYTEDVATSIATILAPTVEFIDPNLVVIGGEAAAAGEVFTKAFSDQLGQTIGWAPEVSVTALADRTVVTGVHILGARKGYASLLGHAVDLSSVAGMGRRLAGAAARPDGS